MKKSLVLHLCGPSVDIMRLLVVLCAILVIINPFIVAWHLVIVCISLGSAFCPFVFILHLCASFASLLCHCVCVYTWLIYFYLNSAFSLIVVALYYILCVCTVMCLCSRLYLSQNMSTFNRCPVVVCWVKISQAKNKDWLTIKASKMEENIIV